MKSIILVLLLLAPLASFGKCLYLPKHSFLLSVSQCNAVTFGPGELRSRSGNFIDMQGESVSGVILSGYATKNVYDWEGNQKPKNFKGWKDDSYQSVFLAREEKSVCDKERGFEIELVSQTPCCDISPKGGVCFVPATIQFATRQK